MKRNVWLVKPQGQLSLSAAQLLFHSSWALPDDWLRPIRPSDGEDETLSWKPVPINAPKETV
jgi:hypothetical protein